MSPSGGGGGNSVNIVKTAKRETEGEGEGEARQCPEKLQSTNNPNNPNTGHADAATDVQVQEVLSPLKTASPKGLDKVGKATSSFKFRTLSTDFKSRFGATKSVISSNLIARGSLNNPLNNSLSSPNSPEEEASNLPRSPKNSPLTTPIQSLTKSLFTNNHNHNHNNNIGSSGIGETKPVDDSEERKEINPFLNVKDEKTTGSWVLRWCVFL